jgi:nucleoside-diphosphate-sugar epimerase
MATVLVTGTGGRIGRRLASALERDHHVVRLTTGEATGNGVTVRGSFGSSDDLCRLDGMRIDVAVHLAAVGGEASEEAALDVNVVRTRRLLRYLVDKGCTKFVMTSSIAAPGCLDPAFLPLELPIPDDHPCLARDAYGLSKALMEAVIHYFHRVVPATDFTVLRLGAVEDEATWTAADLGSQEDLELPFLELAHVALGDAVRGHRAAVEAPYRPGVRILNLVAPEATSVRPVSETLRSTPRVRDSGLDMSGFERPGHEFDPIYRIQAIRDALGFVPEVSLRQGGSASRTRRSR